MTVYNRFDPTKNYDRHLFDADHILQSAEMNELQSNVFYRMIGIANVLLADGSVIRDAACVVNDNGTVELQSGAVYLRGAVRGVMPATLTIAMTGSVIIGIYLQERIITELEDPELLNPAVGTRGYGEPGAARLQVTPVWGTAGDGKDGEFYPVYSIVDGILIAKEPPPNLDGVTQALARYDRDSAGGTYVVSGMTVQMLADDAGGNQVYSVTEGRARVFGYPIEFRTARRFVINALPDLKPIANEPHQSTTADEQRIVLDRTPATNITEVTITAEKTATLTRGVVTGSSDPIPDTSILAILEVKQGATVFADSTYQLTAGKVDWSPEGPEPAPGSTYAVTYRYLTNVIPSQADDTGFTVTGAVVGSLVLVTYSQKLPRIDRICIDQEGLLVHIRGVASEWHPELPAVPANLVSLASIQQTWNASRRVVNDSVRVVPMPVLAGIESRIDRAMQLIAQGRLESNIHTREAGAKRGLFVDPFIDDSQRDAGLIQSAAIVRGDLVSPIDAYAVNVPNDITDSVTCAFLAISALEQTMRTTAIKINPYGAIADMTAFMTLSPSTDRWTETTGGVSARTARFVAFNTVADDRHALQATASDAAETLRCIDVYFEIAGFEPGETISQLTFDGVAIAPQADIANEQGVLRGNLRIPRGIPAGDKLLSVAGSNGSTCAAVFAGQGNHYRQAWRNAAGDVRWQSPPPPKPFTDTIAPLTQTFSLPSTTQIAGCDLFFQEVPTTQVLVQIRATSAGMPSGPVIAEAIVTPDQIVGNLPPGATIPGSTINQRIACSGSGSVTIPAGITSLQIIGRGASATTDSRINRISGGWPTMKLDTPGRPVSGLPASLAPLVPGTNSPAELVDFSFIRQFARAQSEPAPPTLTSHDPNGNFVFCFLDGISHYTEVNPATGQTLNYVRANVVANNGPYVSQAINAVTYGPEIFTETPYASPVAGKTATARIAGSNYAFEGAEGGVTTPPAEKTYTVVLPGANAVTLTYAVPAGAAMAVSYDVPAHLSPSQLATKPTRIMFAAPALLFAGSEYALCVHCNDQTGSLAVAELGKQDADSKTWITSQPYTVGVLLTSSNAREWTAHQDKDLMFRLLAPEFTETVRMIDLGSVPVEAATDLMLLGYAERPDSATHAEYVLTLPDATEIVVSDGQPVQLAAPITGNVQVSAKLLGSTAMAPVLWPGTQLVYGAIAPIADYISRAIPAGANVTVKAVFEALLPSGANIVVDYIGQDAADEWQAMTLDSTRPADDGFTEFTYVASNVTDTTVRVRLWLSGSTSARPRTRDLRVIVM